MSTQAQLSNSVQDTADEIIKETRGRIKLAIPLGLGKPVQLVNCLYRRACQDNNVDLTIYTALSLGKPVAGSNLEKRFLNPFIDRVYGDYEELDYLIDLKRGALPDNVSIHEFFVQPGEMLNNDQAQQNYLCSNYTHAARDLNELGVNIIAQLVAENPRLPDQVSLSCNPEVTLDLLPLIDKRRKAGENILLVAQINKQMPWMPNSAAVEKNSFDIIINDPESHKALFCTPSMPVNIIEHCIGLHASSLVADGGTIQIGIGALGDALTNALLLRQHENKDYQRILENIASHSVVLIDTIGGRGTFNEGLYGCSEMVTIGLLKLFQDGIIKRNVTDSRGRKISLHGGFFLGPSALYESLNSMGEAMLNQIDMTHISFVNALFGEEDLKRTHRQKARFINTAFTVTLMGSAVSDQLDDGRVLSGVGGQYNFVAQAHELEGGRSIILLRSTRERAGEISSNIVWDYGHTTIPRHLRDIVVTEYGIADLRNKTDSEVIAALLNISDSRFQDELMALAKDAGKLPQDYAIPSIYLENFPEKLQQQFSEYKNWSFFPEFPLGSDFTAEEVDLLKSLTWLKVNIKPSLMLKMVRDLVDEDKLEAQFHNHLERMALLKPQSIRETLYKQLLLSALDQVVNHT